jgi:hypothetical protein
MLAPGSPIEPSRQSVLVHNFGKWLKDQTIVKEEGEASGTQPDANVFVRNNDEAPRQSRGQQSGTLQDLDNDSLSDSSEDSLRFSSQLDPAEQNVLSRELEEDCTDLTLSEQEGEASRVEREQRHRSYLLRVIANYPPVDDSSTAPFGLTTSSQNALLSLLQTRQNGDPQDTQRGSDNQQDNLQQDEQLRESFDPEGDTLVEALPDGKKDGEQQAELSEETNQDDYAQAESTSRDEDVRRVPNSRCDDGSDSDGEGVSLSNLGKAWWDRLDKV